MLSIQEERRSLRQELVEIFACLCGLEKEILSELLCSVLPTELAIGIMNNKHGNYSYEYNLYKELSPRNDLYMHKVLDLHI